jgi:hypothetical protein
LLVYCVGDFNAIKEVGEKYCGNQRLNQNIRQFRDFIFETGLVDLGFKRPMLTWTNKPHSLEAVQIRLDRVLVITDWVNLYPPKDQDTTTEVKTFSRRKLVDGKGGLSPNL